jgi:hypothetical protein
MNTNPKLKENLALKKKAISLLSKAIAKIIIKFRLPRTEFINLLDEKLVLEAKRIDPDASNVTLAIRTGIDRRYISKHLKGEMPRSKPNKLAVILEDIRWTAHKFYHSNKIPKTGPFRTFQSICEERAPGSLTYQAILEELIKLGNVEEINSDIRLLDFNAKIAKDEINYSQMTATQINRVTDTIIHNSDIDLKKDKYIQRSIYSTQINPKTLDKVHLELRQNFEKYNSEITKILISYEDDVNVGTYPEYGVSFLEYKAED